MWMRRDRKGREREGGQHVSVAVMVTGGERAAGELESRAWRECRARGPAGGGYRCGLQ